MKPMVKAPYTNEYYEILSREEIMDIVHSLSFEQLFEKAWEGFVPGMKSGYAELRLTDGQLVANSLGIGESNMGADALTITLYKIDQNTVIDPEMILDGEELRKYEESDVPLETFCEQQDIDYMERVQGYFEYHYDGYEHSEILEILHNELNYWYGTFQKE
jgi:hypothetical protein